MACENAATHMVKVLDNPFIPACVDCMHEARDKAAAVESNVEVRLAQGLESRYPCLIGEAP